jgi:hypothetical protein
MPNLRRTSPGGFAGIALTGDSPLAGLSAADLAARRAELPLICP